MTTLRGAFDRQLITASETRTIGTGGTYTTISDAITDAHSMEFLPGVTMTFQLNEQSHSISSPINIHSPWLGNLTITGPTPKTINLTSIASTSGSSGAYSVVCNVNTVLNVSVGNYLFFSCYPTPPSGGTNPLALIGGHLITAVDSVAKTVTISVKAKNAICSGSVTYAGASILKSVISVSDLSNNYCFKVNPGAVIGKFNNCVFVSSGATDGFLRLQDAAHVSGYDTIATGVNFVVHSFSSGVSSGDSRIGCSGQFDQVHFNNCGAAVNLTYNRRMHMDSCGFNGGANVFTIGTNCFLSADVCTFYGGSGYFLTADQRSYATITQSTINQCPAAQVIATAGSFVDAQVMTFTTTGTQYNFIVNTLQTDGGYIKTL
jgi:hypothetical protein